MAEYTLRKSSGELVEVPAVTATAAKNGFGAVLEQAESYGAVAIMKHDKAKAVILSINEYEALLARVPDPLAALAGDFDELVARMRTPAARAAADALFAASPAELGRAARKAARAPVRKKRA